MTVVRRTCERREPVAAKFWRIYNAKFSRHPYECHASVVRRSRDSFEKTCEHLATISGEKIKLLATSIRMSCDTRTNVARLSYE